MFSKASMLSLFCLVSVAMAMPVRREVPQEHSHQSILSAVSKSLNVNNPDGILDPVFGLLGNKAAAGGQGKISNTDCLQQATADRAFTNAKGKGDVNGMVNALMYRALERNTQGVGSASVACTAIKAVNPQIAAVQQHQDPASANAAAVNKAVVLALARQIKSVGGNPHDALKTGTFRPGNKADSTGKGNTCDDANDATGCIFTQNLLVNDATIAEIDAAVGGGSAPPAQQQQQPKQQQQQQQQAPALQRLAGGGGNLQTFGGALGGSSAPPVTKGGRGFVTDNADFVNLAAALGRSCDVQHNKCANIANSNRNAGFGVNQCDQQNSQCRSLIH